MKPAAHLLMMVLTLACGDPAERVDAPAPLEYDETELRALKTVQAIPVEALSGPGEQPFEATTRTHLITQHPCSACHTEPAALASLGGVRGDAHADIVLRHSPETLSCVSCHFYEDMNLLSLQGGTTTSFDRPHLLCRQCHFEQARDWAGGAHGKRLAGWRGRRVVKACTDCHDPHAPAFGKRTPMIHPTIPRRQTGR